MDEFKSKIPGLDFPEGKINTLLANLSQSQKTLNSILESRKLSDLQKDRLRSLYKTLSKESKGVKSILLTLEITNREEELEELKKRLKDEC